MTSSQTRLTVDRSVQPEPLMAKTRPNRLASLSGRSRVLAERSARAIVLALVGRLTHDQLVITEDQPGGTGITTVYGAGPTDLVAEMVVRDARAYLAIVTEGAAGLARGYIEGWWDSADPMTLVRVIVRNLEPIDDLRNRAHRLTSWASDPIKALLPRPDRTRNREDIGAHYDLGNSFFELFLDETMTYSSGIFPRPDATLAEASLHKYDLLLARLGLAPGHHLLEIGTGWGGLAVRAADSIGCRVTTMTISAEQLRTARQRVADAGLAERVRLLDLDWRDLDGTFDRIVSIEMIEAVDWRDYDAYFSTIERCLRPDGLVAIQAICIPDRRYERAKDSEEFIRRFVFPNGGLTSIGAISTSVARATKMNVIAVEDFSAHYAETLRQWRQNFEDRLDAVGALGFDDRFCRLWRFYLAYCEAGFRERHITVNHFVLAGRDWRPAI